MRWHECGDAVGGGAYVAMRLGASAGGVHVADAAFLGVDSIIFVTFSVPLPATDVSHATRCVSHASSHLSSVTSEIGCMPLFSASVDGMTCTGAVSAIRP